MSFEDPGAMAAASDEPTTFIRGSDRIRARRERPGMTEAVRKHRARLRQADREYAIGLATIRKAAELTQTEVAAALGTTQTAVSRLERRHDLMLSTLCAYLTAAGGTHARIVVDFDDGARQVELDLATITAGQHDQP